MAASSLQELPSLAVDVLNALDGPACVLDPLGVIVVVNTAWSEVSRANGGRPETTGPGVNYLQSCIAATSYKQQADREAASVTVDGLRRLLAGEQLRFTYDYACSTAGGELWFSLRAAPVSFAQGTGAVIRHVDVTSHHQAQAALENLTVYDAVTGLANRQLLADRMKQALADGARRRTVLGVAVVDIDRFGQVNASLGSAVGDVVLRQVGAQLTQVVQAGDTVARTSGDEFVVLWRDLNRPEDVEQLGERLRQQVSTTLDLEVTTLPVTCSIGLAAGQPWDDDRDLQVEARAALAEARQQGRGLALTAGPDLQVNAGSRRQREDELAQALRSEQLVVHYQPVMDLRSGRPVAVEGLVRWQHPQQGLLLPGMFVPLAEQSGMVVPMDRWVLQRICLDAADPTGPLAGLNVAVNMSARQLAQPDLVDFVGTVLRETGLEPARLCLEVTESAVVLDASAAQRALEGVVDLGVCVALDDFGTGYSSLLYVRRYPVSILKLDREFVSGLGSSADDEAICASVIRLARAVGAVCIAEGVEAPQQHSVLLSFGCQQAQGWLWSRAVPLHELEEALTRSQDVAPTTEALVETAPVLQLLPEVAAQIQQLQAAGASLHTIAAALNRSGARNPAGVRWGAHAVARYVASASPED